MFVQSMSDKGLVSRIYKTLTKYKSEVTNNPIRKAKKMNTSRK